MRTVAVTSEATPNGEGGRVRFTFGDCPPAIVADSVVAAVEHLCSEANVDVSLLESLEPPLAASLDALHPALIAGTSAHLVDPRLLIRIDFRHRLIDSVDTLLGEDLGLVRAFFDVAVIDNGMTVEMTTTIR